jgi:arylsulfatase A-like enzyme
VLVVSVDGLRPDAIDTYGASTLQRLMREGSYTLSARTIDPSKTLPSHTSMLTGQPPERHGVLWNNVATADADRIELPNVFGLARARGYSTAAFFSKAKFQPLQLEGTLDYSQAPGGLFGRWSSARTVRDVASYLKDSHPNVLFVHLTDPDAAGHHGSDDPRDVTIPWIAWGAGVKPGLLAESSVRTMDTAATVLWLLAVDRPADWAGTPVTQAFKPVAAGD